MSNKGILQYDLDDPDSKEEFWVACNAEAYAFALWDVEVLLREHVRRGRKNDEYSEETTEVLDKIYERFFEIKTEYHIKDIT